MGSQFLKCVERACPFQELGWPEQPPAFEEELLEQRVELCKQCLHLGPRSLLEELDED